VAADSCDALLDHFKDEALSRVGPWGLDGHGVFYPVFRDFATAEDGFRTSAATMAPDAEPASVEGVDYSGTNVQERGVDEPDIVKTDGERIFAIVTNDDHYYDDYYYGGYGSGAVLVAVEITERGPRIVGTLELRRGWGHEMFLDGDRLFVVSNGSRPSVAVDVGPNVWEGDYYIPQVGVTLISEIDVSDLDDMAMVSDLYFDGTYISGRATQGAARFVVRTEPTGLEFTYPKGSGLRAEREAEQANRRVIEDSTIENWLPYYVLEDHSDGSVVEGTLLDCSDVYLPDESAGLGLTAVLTVDTGGGLEVGTASAAIFAAGETIYASADNLYIATNPWIEPAILEGDWEDAAKDFATTIHRFDTSDNDAITYEGSGAVGGYLLNQFAMSEHDGYLRVATTDAASRWGFAPDQESWVTTMEIESMAVAGRVGELGRGEQIYSVRFVADIAYVVTFRQVDPLYTIDLSDPSQPAVLGELKIPGYSAYLHPVGEGRILGVGQDATLEGRIMGTQVSLFDVSDLAAPELISKVTLSGDGSSSTAEYDHRAFLYWAPAELAVLPVQIWDYDGYSESYFNGAIGFHIHDDEVHILDRITHLDKADYWDYRGQILRSLVVGDELYTISNLGIEVSDVDDLDEIEFVSF